MRKTVALLLLLLPASAAAADDVVLKAMTDELRRSARSLKLEGLDAPYFLSYTVLDSSDTQLSAVFGALRDDASYVNRTASVELRVGSAAFDSSWYAGQDYGAYRPGTAQLAEEDGYDALRAGLWDLTDDVYKKALEVYSRKKAYLQKKNIRERYGDLSREKKERYFSDRTEAPRFDSDAWRAAVKRLSAVFRECPGVQGSQVVFTRALRTVRFANTEGTAYRYWWDKVNLDVKAVVQDRTGLRISDELKLSWRSMDDVPPLPELERQVAGFAKNMNYLVDSSSAEVYLGPVLFEDQAAAEFLNQLFVRSVSFARTPWADREDWTRYYIDSGDLAKKLNMRVLPPFIGVTDDPGRAVYGGLRLNGAYPIDSEGVKPAPLELVKNGRLVSFYMGRAPVKEFASSNGHGRGFLNEFPTGRPGNVFFSAAPEKRAPKAKLKAELLRLAKENGLDYALVARRLDPEDQKQSEALLAGPVLLYKVKVSDGSETLVGGAEWTGVTFRALRDILLTADSDYIYNYYQPGPFLYNRGYVPASIVAPAGLLVQELELKPTEAKPDRQPYLPHPYFAGK